MDALEASLAGAAVVFATHDLGLALRRATRILVLVDGDVLYDGPPIGVLDLPGLPMPLPPLAKLCGLHGLPLVSVERLLEVW